MQSGSHDNLGQHHLLQQYGPLVGGSDLVQVLGFKNTAAMRQARRRGRIAVRTFRIAGRQGLFALTVDVAAWLSEVAGGDNLIEASTDDA